MCGIAGFCNFDQHYTKEKEKWFSILWQMNHAQNHRGPDDSGVCLKERCGLAQVRLAVIDLKTGHQPILRSENGRDYAIIYNGELYNMHELKEELIREGVVFTTSSDAEVALYGFMRHGPEFVKRMNGIFSFAVWDAGLDRLVLFRDPIGVKPLFYTVRDGTLVFGSELKTLFCYPGVKSVIDKKSLREVFALGPAKTPGQGVFRDVSELNSGHFLIYDRNGLREEAYWSLQSAPHTDSYDRTVEKTAFLIQDAVKRQMLADIPVCTFLSGGVDSSLVTAICAKELAKQGKQLNTFSFDFHDNHIYFHSNSFQPSEDRPFVDRMVSCCNTNHTYLECSNEQLADYLFKAVDARDLPCMADVESSLLYFCSQVVKQNKVALTGECADEIFGGYPWFHKKECFEADIFPWSMDLGTRSLLLRDDFAKELELENYAKSAYQKTVSETPVLEGENPEEKRRREISYLNLKWFMVTLLDRMDRTSMYSGLEARVPFADPRIVEYLWNVPWHMKCPKGIVKGLLRQAGEGLLPEDILYRRKSPYPKTYDPAYEKLLGSRLLDVLADPAQPLSSYADRQKVERYLSTPADYGRPFYGQLMAGPQLLAYLLQVNYWLKKYA